MNKTQKYRMVAVDMDGTLLNPDSELSDYAAGVLRAVADKGVKVVICTGRAYVGAVFFLRKIGLNNPCVFCNGAQIRNALDGAILHEHPLPLDEARLAIRLGEEAGGHPRIYMDDHVYVSHMIEEDRMYSESTRSKVDAVGNLSEFLQKAPSKVIVFMSDREAVPVLLQKSDQTFQNRLYITQSISINRTTFVEYMNLSATKGNGIKKVAGMWGFSRDEIIVAGDHLNDLTMFEEAGFSIAPQNAHPSVISAASAVCRSNAEDGVPKKLAEMFLSGGMVNGK